MSAEASEADRVLAITERIYAEADEASTEASGGLTEAEKNDLLRAASSPYISIASAVEGIVAAREAKARAGVDAVLVCPHGPRHYYAADATCQRCQMPSWVEATVRAARGDA